MNNKEEQVSLLTALQKEGLAEGQLRHREVRVEKEAHGKTLA